MDCFKKRNNRNLDPPNRFKLDEQQKAYFDCLKNELPTVREPTLCYWLKSYSFTRIQEVMYEARHWKATNFEAYMGKLLAKGSDAPLGRIAINRELATVLGGSGRIRFDRNCVFIKKGRSEVDIPLSMKVESFAQRMHDYLKYG